MIRFACSILTAMVAFLAGGCTRTVATRQAPATRAGGEPAPSARILPPSSGTALQFCSSPGLHVDLRLDSLVAADTPVAMGTAEVDAGKSNAGTHNDTDEITYF